MFLKKKNVVPKLNFKNIELLPEFTEKHISPKNPMTKVFEKGQKEHFEFYFFYKTFLVNTRNP